MAYFMSKDTKGQWYFYPLTVFILKNIMVMYTNVKGDILNSPTNPVSDPRLVEVGGKVNR